MKPATRNVALIVLSILVVGIVIVTLPSALTQTSTPTPTPVVTPTPSPPPTNTTTPSPTPSPTGLYYPTQTYSVNVVVNYAGAGNISPSGNNTYTYGSYIVFWETANPGYSFNGWYINGVYEGKLADLPVSVTQDYQIVAVYSRSVNYMTINWNGPGTTNPTAGSASYGTGTVVTITESPSSGATFSGWYLNGVFMGTSTSLVVTMNQDNQVDAFFAGGSASPTPAPTAMPAPTPNPSLAMPTLQFYCTSRTSNSAFEVEIAGSLACNGSGLVNAGIYLSYSVTNGNTWQDFAYIQTGAYGNFTADWMPSASGNYIIRAIYFGDNFYSPETVTSNFALTPLENQNQNVFSVISNSTVTSLAFSSSSDSLSFGVSGQSGTMGYAQICIAKSLLPDVSKLQVTLDSSTVSYASYSDGSNWLITIYYHHSSHTVVMNLNSPTALTTPTPSPSPSPNSSSTASPTSASSATPTLSPAATPTVSPASTSSSTPVTPEFPVIAVPVILVMIGLAISVLANKRMKPKM